MCKLIPLSLAEPGKANLIKKIGGNDEAKRYLETLGFVVGGSVSVVNCMGGNVIVNIKDSRVAISKEMANRIMI